MSKENTKEIDTKKAPEVVLRDDDIKRKKKNNKSKQRKTKRQKRPESVKAKREEKKRTKRKTKKVVFVVLGVICGLGLIALGLFLFLPELRVRGFSEKREISFGEEYKDDFGEICFGNYFSCDEAKVEIFGDKVDEEKIGDYHRYFKVFYGNGEERELSQIISVVDKRAPEIVVKQDKVSVCPNGKIPKFEMEIKDDYDGDITENAQMKFEDEKVIVEVQDSSGNRALSSVSAVVEDTKAPEINLNGAETYTMTLDAIFEIPTPTVSDNCDEVELVTRGAVDTKKVGTYELIYEAVDNSGNSVSIKRTVRVDPVPENGVIYLTFDDGPGAFTDKLLDVLKKYNVKATFFVTGSGEDRLIKRAFDEGHAIGLHTFTHDYSYVYKNVNNYFDDLNKIQERVKRITGKESRLIRFPGGSSNTISQNYDGGVRIMSKLVDEVTKRGYVYFDWNVSSGDAGSTTSASGVYSNVINGLKKGGSSVVLQHDIKGFSVDAVEDIIKYGQSHGYKFAALDISSFTSHHGVNN